MEQARPAGIGEGIAGGLLLAARDDAGRAPGARADDPRARPSGPPSPWRWPVSCWPTVFYGLRKLDPEDVRRHVRARSTRFLRAQVVVRRVVRVRCSSGRCCASPAGSPRSTSRASTGWPTTLARAVELDRRLDDWIDRIFVDGSVNLIGRWTYALGLRLRSVQTGKHPPVRDVDRRRHRGAVCVDEFVWNMAITDYDELALAELIHGCIDHFDYIRESADIDSTTCAVEPDHLSARGRGARAVLPLSRSDGRRDAAVLAADHGRRVRADGLAGDCPAGDAAGIGAFRRSAQAGMQNMVSPRLDSRRSTSTISSASTASVCRWCS